LSQETPSMTYFHAALTILAYADRPLTVGELTAVAVADGLVHPRGRTPDRTMSSVLYRRMASDPNAPVVSNGGRFWLRDRSLPTQSGSVLRSAIRKVHRVAGTHHDATHRSHAAPRPPSVLPPPPLRLPHSDTGQAAQPKGAAPGLPRQERAVARLADRLRRLTRKIAPLWEGSDAWTADHTAGRAVAPLLTLLGYRRADRLRPAPVRGRVAQLLLSNDQPAILCDTFRAGHDLADADARSTIGRALAQHIPWAMVTNGREVRVYASSLPDASQRPAGALVLRVAPFAWADDQTLLDTAHLLWLFSRTALASGALAGYLAARAVGTALLGAFDDPASDLAVALAAAVYTTTGLDLPAAELARHARLAIRMARGRDGEPLAEDATRVAAVGATRPMPAMQPAGDMAAAIPASAGVTAFSAAGAGAQIAAEAL
jgi:hypothetical protein